MDELIIEIDGLLDEIEAKFSDMRNGVNNFLSEVPW